MKNQNAGEGKQTYSTTLIDRWEEYELEKAKLRELDLDYGEYAKRLREICDRLGI